MSDWGGGGARRGVPHEAIQDPPRRRPSEEAERGAEHACEQPLVEAPPALHLRVRAQSLAQQQRHQCARGDCEVARKPPLPRLAARLGPAGEPHFAAGEEAGPGGEKEHNTGCAPDASGGGVVEVDGPAHAALLCSRKQGG